MSRPEILLVYDKECPACNAYCQIIRIRETVGDLKIIDAREKVSHLMTGQRGGQGSVLRVATISAISVQT